ncbi:MIF2 [Candida theae]|uniref:MIF2 n=1 Tax=Candida theae TaxID=1198502 RepID=A0AAD5BGB3_9ASCO|nr:MIF2 [Candida theae]KAI5961335.1 MIF2 [Candida theae]
MELLQLGKRSRKLGLTIKANLHRDEYGMDDMDEFFADDTQAQIMLREQDERVLRQGEVYKSPTSYNVTTRMGRFGNFGGATTITAAPKATSTRYGLQQGTGGIPPYDSGFDVEDIGNDYASEKEDQSPFNYVARKIDFDNGEDMGGGPGGEQNQMLGVNKQSPLRSPLPEQRQGSSLGASQRDNFLDDVDDYDFAQQDDNYFDQDQELRPEDSQGYDPGSGQQDDYDSRSVSPPPPLSPPQLPPPQLERSVRAPRSSRRLDQRSKRRNSFSESDESTQASVSAFIEDTKDTDEDDEEVTDAGGSTTTELFVRSPSTDQSQSQSQSQPKRKKRSNRSQPSGGTSNMSPTYITEVPTLPSPPPEGLRRSKRIRIKPLAFWRNERIIFTKPHQKRPDEEKSDDDDDDNDEPDMTIVRDVHKLPLRSIAEVVHVPDTVELLSTRQNRRNRRRKLADAPISPISSDEHDPEEQNVLQSGLPGTSWYKDKVLKVNVPENGKFIERSIAVSSQYTDFKSNLVLHEDGTTSEDPNLRIMHLFSNMVDDCAVGMMELIGTKPPLYISSSNYYLLIVKGIVEVTFNEETFIANKGCNICIPSGNEYGMKNLGKEPALIHFVQVRKPETEDGDDGGDEDDEDDDSDLFGARQEKGDNEGAL